MATQSDVPGIRRRLCLGVGLCHVANEPKSDHTACGRYRKLAELGADIDRTVHTMQDEATLFADPNDRASQESDMSLELRNRDRERKMIKKIERMGPGRGQVFVAGTHAASVDSYEFGPVEVSQIIGVVMHIFSATPKKYA